MAHGSENGPRVRRVLQMNSVTKRESLALIYYFHVVFPKHGVCKRLFQLRPMAVSVKCPGSGLCSSRAGCPGSRPGARQPVCCRQPGHRGHPRHAAPAAAPGTPGLAALRGLQYIVAFPRGCWLSAAQIH